MKSESEQKKNIEYQNLPIPQTEDWNDWRTYIDNEFTVIANKISDINDSLLTIRTYLGI